MARELVYKRIQELEKLIKQQQEILNDTNNRYVYAYAKKQIEALQELKNYNEAIYYGTGTLQ